MTDKKLFEITHHAIEELNKKVEDAIAAALPEEPWEHLMNNGRIEIDGRRILCDGHPVIWISEAKYTEVNTVTGKIAKFSIQTETYNQHPSKKK